EGRCVRFEFPGTAGGASSLSRSVGAVLRQLLLRASAPRCIHSRMDGTPSNWADQYRLSICAVTVLHGVGPDVALHPQGATVRRHGSAGPAREAQRRRQPPASRAMISALAMFVAFVAITLGITYWASKRTQTTAEFYSAGRGITGFQNGWAVA